MSTYKGKITFALIIALMLGLAGMQPNISTAIAAVNEDKQARLEKELEELQSEAVNLEKAFEL
ncbi:MAG: hypothetical protein ACUZ77_12580, partial [Candidatus Brocadiales bacterium]